MCTNNNHICICTTIHVHVNTLLYKFGITRQNVLYSKFMYYDGYMYALYCPCYVIHVVTGTGWRSTVDSY